MWLLEILIDLGLLVADENHYRKVKKKEKEDGKSIPFQKYILTPSARIYGSVLLLVIFLSTCWFLYTSIVSYPKDTLKEMEAITDYILMYEENTGEKVQSLETVVKGRPLKKDWLKDAWGQPYQLITIPTFELLSSGRDRKFGTEDDIRISH